PKVGKEHHSVPPTTMRSSTFMKRVFPPKGAMIKGKVERRLSNGKKVAGRRWPWTSVLGRAPLRLIHGSCTAPRRTCDSGGPRSGRNGPLGAISAADRRRLA